MTIQSNDTRPPTLGIVLVNWNGWRDTIECIRSLGPALGEQRIKVVVVDNGSTDDSVPRLAEWAATSGIGVTFEQVAADIATTADVALLVAGANNGFAAGNNIGLRYLERHTPTDLYWLLNNDSVVGIDAIDELVTYSLQTPDIAIIGCTIAEYDKRSVVQCAGGARYSKLTTINRPAYRRYPVSSLGAVPEPDLDYICGAAMLIRRDALQAIGLLEEDYFLYYEEIDYAERARRLGFKLGWCRNAVVYHKGGASTGGNRQRANKSAVAEYHANLSCLKYTAKFHRSNVHQAALIRFGLKLAFIASNREWRLLRPLVTAYRDYYRSLLT